MKRLIFLLAFLCAEVQAGEFVTVLGVGLKFNNFSSAILDPECKQVDMRARGGRGPSSCGGNNPIFIGWPIAFDFNGRRTRIGWFHFSSIGDGGGVISWRGDRHETRFNCFCMTHTIRWKR